MAQDSEITLEIKAIGLRETDPCKRTVGVTLTNIGIGAAIS